MCPWGIISSTTSDPTYSSLIGVPGHNLNVIHDLRFYSRLMEQIRQAISEGRLREKAAELLAGASR